MVMHCPYLLWTESLPSSSVFALCLMECGWQGAGSSATQPKWRVITVKYRPPLCRLILRAVITVQTNRHISNQGQIHWLTSKIKPPLNATITITVKEWPTVIRQTYTLPISEMNRYVSNLPPAKECCQYPKNVQQTSSVFVAFSQSLGKVTPAGTWFLYVFNNSALLGSLQPWPQCPLHPFNTFGRTGAAGRTKRPDTKAWPRLCAE